MMMAKSRIFLIITALQIIVLIGLIIRGRMVLRARLTEELPQKMELVKRLEITDLAIWTEARYTRHPSQADFFAPFQDGPSSLEHFPAGSVGVPHHKAGRVRAIGFTGAKRLSSLPDIPTVGETVKGYVADAGWHGVFAPAGTPAAIVTKVQQAIHKALQDPKVRAHFVDNGYDPQGDAPADWARQYRADVKRFAQLAKAAGIEPQ